MGSVDDISQLCRLCLVKDQVNIPIFDGSSEIGQTFVKINSCLPVKVSRDDNLPKKICDGCSYKLDMLYIFRNTSVDSEKQLISWLSQSGLSTISQAAAKDPLANAKPEIMVKQETFDSADSRVEGDNPDMGVDAQNYILQQQQLPYQQDFEFGEPSGSIAEMTDEPTPKRAKRAAALKKAPIEDIEETEDDLDAAMQITKAEEEDSEDVDQPDYVEAPSTSADDQPGPSGVGKAPVEAPIYKTEPYGCQEITVITIDGDNEVLVSIPTEDLTTVKPKPTKAKPKHTTKQTILEPVTTGTTEPSSSDKVPGIKKRDRVVCHECGILVTWDYLSTHMYEMHYYMSDLESPSVLCSECGTLCKNKRAHANHVRIHSFYCTQCPSVFKSENDLVKHSLVHTKKQYECNKCDLSFDDCYVFILHNESHDASGNFSCVKCNYVTGSCSSMKRHLQQHGGRTVHTCDICSRKFFGKTRFDAHMELHAGIPKYSCEYCPKKFSTKNYLKVHRELNHHKELYGYEMSYSCRECGRKFKFETSLKRHLSTIHKIGEDRTVTCKICYKKIANNYNLRVHMRLHTGEKTNMCESCGKAYSTYKSYKKHVLKHHPNVEPVPKTQPKSLQLGKGVTC